MEYYPGADEDILEQLGVKHRHSMESWVLDPKDLGYIIKCRCGARGWFPLVQFVHDPNRGKVVWDT